MRISHGSLGGTLGRAAVFACLTGAGLFPATASASIHELVAAFCSGGDKGVIGANGHLEAPGVSGGSNADNFARPANASGAAVVVREAPLRVEIGDGQSAKYPEGTTVVDLATFTFLAVSQSDHAATHCRNFSLFQ